MLNGMIRTASKASCILHIAHATTAQDVALAKALMIEYRDTALGDDYAIAGGGLNAELEQFPQPYVPPTGALLLAKADGVACGCLALRPLCDTQGEVVRMYVQPAFRGQGIAEALMRELMAQAQTLGYRTLFLDSLKRFKPAHALYEKLGFTYCDPYDLPHTTDAMREHMIFMRRDV